MKTTGLSFTGEMVRALLANRKFQTRRIVKIEHRAVQSSDDGQWYDADGIRPGRLLKLPNAPKDMLYVKEAWCPQIDASGNIIVGARPFYKERDGLGYLHFGNIWKSGRFMPRWVARIWLEATACRFEWLQDISANDCLSSRRLSLPGVMGFEGASPSDPRKQPASHRP